MGRLLATLALLIHSTTQMRIHHVEAFLSATDLSRQTKCQSSWRKNDEVPNLIAFARPFLPYKFNPIEASQHQKQERPFESVVVRHLQDEDLPSTVRMCVREFGPSNPQNRQFPLTRWLTKHPPLNGLAVGAIYIQNYILAWVVYLGLYSRIRVRMWGETHPNAQQDHHVLCLSEPTEKIILGIAEVSFQPPYQTAPPFVLPFFFKRLLCQFNPTLQCGPVPYLSNVVIQESFRGFGYGSVLMEAIECHAKDVLGCHQLTLHIDANGAKENAAWKLYRRMGYKPIDDDRHNFVPFNDKNERGTGMYMIGGEPMIYMRKDLE